MLADVTPQSRLHYDTTDIGQGSSAQDCFKKGTPHTDTGDKNREEIFDNWCTFHGFFNTSKSSVHAGYDHNRSGQDRAKV
jgi:hypothetical protein